MGNALGLGQIGILVRFLRDFYVIFFVNLTWAAEKIEKNKSHQNRCFFVFLWSFGIGKKKNAVGLGQNCIFIR